MNYSKIITYDTANCRGFSVTMWVCGCDNKCEECFNPELWDYKCGKEFNQETYNTIKRELNKPFITSFVLLGGEPLSDKNRQSSFKILQNLKKDCAYKTKIVYTGYTIEELNLTPEEIDSVDFIIDGRYDKNLPTPYPQLRGSLNQRCFMNDNGVLVDMTKNYFT